MAPGKIAKTIGGVGGRCAGKRKKAGGVLRYMLICVLELAKSVRET